MDDDHGIDVSVPLCAHHFVTTLRAYFSFSPRRLSLLFRAGRASSALRSSLMVALSIGSISIPDKWTVQPSDVCAADMAPLPVERQNKLVSERPVVMSPLTKNH